MYMFVVLICFLTLRISIFENKIVEGNKHRCVNKTSRDKGWACANEKRKRCNRIPSDITLDRDYAAWGYVKLMCCVYWCIFVSSFQITNACCRKLFIQWFFGLWTFHRKFDVGTCFWAKCEEPRICQTEK